jgi:hypothetical protein
MSWFGGLNYAVVVPFIVLAGCTSPGLPEPESHTNNLQHSSKSADRFIPCPLQTVCSKIQNTLSEMNVLSHASQEGEGMRIECWTRSDLKFTYLLTSCTMKNAKCTRVHVGWDHGEDPDNGLNDPLVVQILDRVETACLSEPNKKNASATAPNGTAKDQAIAFIERLGGHVERQTGGQDPPVIGVDLHKSRVSDDDLAVVRNFPQLQRLNLYGTNVTGPGLMNLQGLRALQLLNLNDTAIGDVALANIRDLPALKELNLRNTRVTDRGLANLQTVPALERLALRGPGITDAGLASLRSMKNLVYLQLSGTAATEAGISDLQRALPKLKVIR